MQGIAEARSVSETLIAANGVDFDELVPLWARFRRWLTSPAGLLVVVCLAHLGMALAFVASQHMWWQQDEVVYLSQVAAHTPALNFTPPRARGLPVLIYPLVHFTTNPTLVRSYIAVLSTAFLYVGLRPWLRLGFSRSVAGAGLLFSGLWATSFFGAEIQPNLIVATLSVGALGHTVLALRAIRKHGHLVAAALFMALLALVRPSDATWFAVPLILSFAVVGSVTIRRRLQVAGALVVGLALGWSEWVIEAYVSYGGFFHRLHEANALNTPGLHFSLLAEARDINGPILCRPCSGVPLSPSHFLWWLAVPPLIAIGLISARGTRRWLPLMLATVCGVGVLAEYCLTIDYAAPRFLLPTYLLLALPCAAGLGALLRWRPDSGAHIVIVTGIVTALLAQFVVQARTLHSDVVTARDNRNRFVTAAALLRESGVRAPCIVLGSYGPPVAFALGCSDLPKGQPALDRVRTGTTVTFLSPTPLATGLRQWQVVPLKRNHSWTGYVLHPTNELF